MEHEPPSAAQKKMPYSGYYNRPPQGDDPLLTHVGPGTPCGEYMRRYWQPFCSRRSSASCRSRIIEILNECCGTEAPDKKTAVQA